MMLFFSKSLLSCTIAWADHLNHKWTERGWDVFLSYFPRQIKKSISYHFWVWETAQNCFQRLSALFLSLLKCSVSAFGRSFERKYSTDSAAIPSFLLETGKFLSTVSSHAWDCQSSDDFHSLYWGSLPPFFTRPSLHVLEQKKPCWNSTCTKLAHFSLWFPLPRRYVPALTRNTVATQILSDFYHFLTFSYNKMVQVHCVFFPGAVLELLIFSKNSVFHWY